MVYTGNGQVWCSFCSFSHGLPNFPQPPMPTSIPLEHSKEQVTSVSFPTAAIAQAESLNAYWTKLMTPSKLSLTLNPFKSIWQPGPKHIYCGNLLRLMRQLIVRISKLHREPSQPLWKWSPGPLLKSPVKKAAPGSSEGPVWLTARLIDFGFENNSQGAGVWVRGRIWWGRWDPEGDAQKAESSEVPLPWPSRHEEPWSGSHCTGLRSPRPSLHL